MSRLTLLCCLFSCSLSAQFLAVEEPVLDSLRARYTVWNDSMTQRGYARHGLFERMLDVVRGTHVNGGYLTDQLDRVYNIGVLDQPFILVTVHEGRPEQFAGIRDFADELEGEFLVFLMVATPTFITDEVPFHDLGENVIVVYEHNFRTYEEAFTDQRLLGLIAWPMTYFIASDRRIVELYNAGIPNLEKKSGAPSSRRKRHKKAFKRALKLLREYEEFSKPPRP